MENLNQGRPVNADKVIEMLSQRVAELEKERALLTVYVSELQGEIQGDQQGQPQAQPQAIRQPPRTATKNTKKGSGK